MLDMMNWKFDPTALIYINKLTGEVKTPMEMDKMKTSPEKVSNKKLQPKAVQRINCPKCGELQIKIYPWSSYQLAIGVDSKQICIKCANK